MVEITVIIWLFALAFDIDAGAYRQAFYFLWPAICFCSLVTAPIAEDYINESVGAFLVVVIIFLVGLPVYDATDPAGALSPKIASQLGTTFCFGIFLTASWTLCGRRVRNLPRSINPTRHESDPIH